MACVSLAGVVEPARTISSMESFPFCPLRSFLAFRLCLRFMGGGIFSFSPFPCGSNDLDGWVGGWEEDLIDSIHLSR